MCPSSLDDKTHGLLGDGKHTPDVCGHGEQDQHAGEDDRARASRNTFLLLRFELFSRNYCWLATSVCVYVTGCPAPGPTRWRPTGSSIQPCTLLACTQRRRQSR
jgi:hypothetical protein